VRALLSRAAVVAVTVAAAIVFVPAAQATDVDAAREQVAELGREVEAASAEYSQVEARLQAQQGRVEAAEARIVAQTEAIERMERDLAAAAVETFKRGGVDPQLATLVGGSDYRASTATLTLLAERRAVSLSDLEDANGELERVRGLAERELGEVAALEADLAQRRADIEQRLAEAEDLLALAEAEEQARIAAQEARAAAQASRGGSRSVAAGSGVLQTPVGGRQTPFGYRVHPVYGDTRFHSGMDIITSCGVPVVAAADGVVSSAKWDGSYGNILVIDHGDIGGVALSTAYAHLNGFATSGGSVARGEVIGWVGTTGLSTGCHLHFEVRQNGEAVDPAAYL
jgi:murein DD-endopeptidase MepM/ murein hydrolase activator NlpD